MEGPELSARVAGEPDFRGLGGMHPPLKEDPEVLGPELLEILKAVVAAAVILILKAVAA